MANFDLRAWIEVLIVWAMGLCQEGGFMVVFCTSVVPIAMGCSPVAIVDQVMWNYGLTLGHNTSQKCMWGHSNNLINIKSFD